MTETASIRAIAAGGDGVGALADGCTVFVPRTAPGDVVELAQVRRSRRHARARIGRLLERSSHRVLPRCPHYDAQDCGGCQMQHLEPEAQREARRMIVGDALRRIGHLDAADVALVPSETEWNYRTRITLAVRRRRIGFHRVGRPDEVFDLAECHIARPEINALWAKLSTHRHLLPRQADRIVLRIDRDGALHVIVKVTGTEVWTNAAQLGQALRNDGGHATLWWEPEGGTARTMFGASEAYPAMVFEQIHPAMGDRVRAHAVLALGELSGNHCWDLYAGIGETTALLLAAGATVESVELDRRAVALADARGPHGGVTRYAGTVEDHLARLRPAGRVILNPPRSGLGEAVTSALLHGADADPSLRGREAGAARDPGSRGGAEAISRLVYISCDPATLARDLDRLREAFAVVDVTAFDLFPQTAHVETVVRLDRR